MMNVGRSSRVRHDMYTPPLHRLFVPTAGVIARVRPNARRALWLYVGQRGCACRHAMAEPHAVRAANVHKASLALATMVGAVGARSARTDVIIHKVRTGHVVLRGGFGHVVFGQLASQRVAIKVQQVYVPEVPCRQAELLCTALGDRLVRRYGIPNYVLLVDAWLYEQNKEQCKLCIFMEGAATDAAALCRSAFPRTRRMPSAQGGFAARMSYQVLAACWPLLRCNVHHCDLKLNNVVCAKQRAQSMRMQCWESVRHVRTQGQLYQLTDFGTARLSAHSEPLHGIQGACVLPEKKRPKLLHTPGGRDAYQDPTLTYYHRKKRCVKILDCYRLSGVHSAWVDVFNWFQSMLLFTRPHCTCLWVQQALRLAQWFEQGGHMACTLDVSDADARKQTCRALDSLIVWEGVARSNSARAIMLARWHDTVARRGNGEHLSVQDTIQHSIALYCRTIFSVRFLQACQVDASELYAEKHAQDAPALLNYDCSDMARDLLQYQQSFASAPAVGLAGISHELQAWSDASASAAHGTDASTMRNSPITSLSAAESE